MKGVQIEAEKVQSNIVIFAVTDPRGAVELTRALAGKNVLASAIDPTHVRLVTHMDVDRARCERALEAVREVLAA